MVELPMAKEILITSEDILTNGIISQYSQDVVIGTVTNITNPNSIIATVTATIMVYIDIIVNTIANTISTISQNLIPWVVEHKDWLLGIFSGIGLVFPVFVWRIIKRLFSRRKKKLQINTSFYIAIEENMKAKILADLCSVLNVNSNSTANNIANLSQAQKSIIYPVLRFEIINVSTTDTVTIKSVSWDFCGKKITYYGKLGIGRDNVDGVEQIDPNDNKYNDKELHPNGGVLKGTFKISWFVTDKEFCAQFKERDKIRLVVHDMLGNRYYSKKYKYKEFVEQVAIAIVAAKGGEQIRQIAG